MFPRNSYSYVQFPHKITEYQDRQDHLSLLQVRKNQPSHNRKYPDPGLYLTWWSPVPDHPAHRLHLPSYRYHLQHWEVYLCIRKPYALLLYRCLHSQWSWYHCSVQNTGSLPLWYQYQTAHRSCILSSLVLPGLRLFFPFSVPAARSYPAWKKSVHTHTARQ